MASNRELATRARELGRARGIDVDTRGLDNAGLSALVDRLEAEQPPAAPSPVATAAEPPDALPDGVTAQGFAEELPASDGDDGDEPESPRAPRRRGVFVAPERAVLCARGVHLHAGDEVQEHDFDEATFRRLLAKGTILIED